MVVVSLVCRIASIRGETYTRTIVKPIQNGLNMEIFIYSFHKRSLYCTGYFMSSRQKQQPPNKNAIKRTSRIMHKISRMYFSYFLSNFHQFHTTHIYTMHVKRDTIYKKRNIYINRTMNK